MRYGPVTVAAAVVLGGALLARGGGLPAGIGALYVAAVTVPLAVVDARERRLPNALVLPGYAFAGLGVVWAGLARGSPPWSAVVSAGLAIAVCLVPAVVGGIGMGDVKLAGLLAGALAAAVAGRGPPGEEVAGTLVASAAWFAAGFGAAGLAGVAALWGGRGRDAELAVGPLLLGAFWAVVVLW